MATGRKTGGRSKGTPNKATAAAAERIAEAGCDPLAGMVRIAAEAEKAGDLSLAGRMLAELASYIYPKRKAVDLDVAEHPTVIQVRIGGSPSIGERIGSYVHTPPGEPANGH